MESYLLDEVCIFKQIFTIDDPACCTSEISPIHLNIPKSFLAKLPHSSSINDQTQPTSPNSIHLQDSPQNKQVTKRILNTQYKQSEKTTPMQNETSKIQHQKVSPLIQATMPRKDKDHAKPVQIKTITVSPFMKGLSENPSGFSFFAIPNKTQEQFQVIRNGKEISCMIPGVDKPLFKGKYNNGEFTVSDADGHEIGEMLYSKENRAHYFVLSETRTEIVSIQHNPVFLPANLPCVFDMVIPAVQHRGEYMQAIQFESSLTTSSLIILKNEGNKKVISLSPRVPKSTGNSYDMTFDGKFEENSNSNFILFFQRKAADDLLLFELKSDGTGILTIKYPLSPIQGFVAATQAIAPSRT